MTTRRASRVRTWLIWTAGFLAFPIAGLAGAGAAGRLDDPSAALPGVVMPPVRAPVSASRRRRRRTVVRTLLAGAVAA